MGILLVIHVLVTVFLILIVLIQKNEGGSSLFASSGGTSGMFNARGTSNILTKATWVLATLFLVNCVLMATIDSSRLKKEQSLIETKQEKPLPANPEKQDEKKADSKKLDENSKKVKTDSDLKEGAQVSKTQESKNSKK